MVGKNLSRFACVYMLKSQPAPWNCTSYAMMMAATCTNMQGTVGEEADTNSWDTCQHWNSCR